MMENTTIFKYVTCPVVGSYLIPLKPVEDLLMVSVELGPARRMQKCCLCSEDLQCDILVILWENMT